MATENSQSLQFFFDQKEIFIWLDENQNPWFLAKHVCEALGINNVSDALNRLDDDEKRGLYNTIVSTDGVTKVNQLRNYINESGLYSLAMTSKKLESKRFKKMGNQ